MQHHAGVRHDQPSAAGRAEQQDRRRVAAMPVTIV